jgi:hypothetical protein
MNKIFIKMMLVLVTVVLSGGCATNQGSFQIIKSWKELGPTYLWGRNDLPFPTQEVWHDGPGFHDHFNTADNDSWKHDRDCEKNERAKPTGVNIVQQGNGNLVKMDNSTTIINNNTTIINRPQRKKGN